MMEGDMVGGGEQDGEEDEEYIDVDEDQLR